MSTSPEIRKADLIARINVRLSLWSKLWVVFLVAYFLLGTSSVALSALAATDIFEGKTRQACSVVAAVCVALLGFLRPEVRYRNLVRAWRELDVEKTRYVHGEIDASTERMLQALARTERVASDDEHDSAVPTGDEQKLADEISRARKASAASQKPADGSS